MKISNKVMPDDGLGPRGSNEETNEEYNDQPPKSKNIDDITMWNQKMAMVEGGVIHEWSDIRSNSAQDLCHVVSTTKTEKTSNTSKELNGNCKDSRCHSPEAKLSHSTNQQRGVDMSSNKRPPVPHRFSVGISSGPSILEKSDSRLGAIAIPGPGAAEPQHHSTDSVDTSLADDEDSVKIDLQESSMSTENTGERLITAFLVEVQQEHGENTPPAPTAASLPLAKATVVVDTKNSRRRTFLLIGCCLVIGIAGGALAAVFLDTADEETQPPITSVPTSTTSDTAGTETQPSTTPVLTATTSEPPTTPVPTATTSDPTYQSEWEQVGGDITTLLDGKDSTEFGRSVSLSLDGNILAAGARMAGVQEESSREAGRVEVFSLSASREWSSFGKSISSEDEMDKSGQSVSLSDDGRTIAISAPNHHKVRIYQFSDSDWDKIGTDIESDQTDIADSDSNSYIALSGDGRVVAIGAPWKDITHKSYHGHVRVYEYDRNEEKWVQRGLDINGIEAGDNLGFSTWLNADGTILAAGAFQNVHDDKYAGYACVYQWKNDIWNKRGNCVQGEEAGDHFGVSVSMSGDAMVLAVGGDHVDAGHVRVFRWDQINETWGEMGNRINGTNNSDLA